MPILDHAQSLSPGARHYVVMVIPRLLRDIEELGLPRIIQTSVFSEQEVTRLYFEFVSIRRVLPAAPDSIPAEIWEHLVYCVQVMSSMVNAASLEELVQAREQAVRKFLPHARATVESEYQEQCSDGTVDLRLAGMLRQESSSEQATELCMEALRIERQERLASIAKMSLTPFDGPALKILEEAKSYVAEASANPPDNFGHVDLIIRLLDLLRVVVELEKNHEAKSSIPDEFSEENIILGIGNSLYRESLGLTFSTLRSPRL